MDLPSTSSAHTASNDSVGGTQEKMINIDLSSQAVKEKPTPEQRVAEVFGTSDD